MILFDLRCSTGHVFEAWFRDGATYDRQVEAHEVACPLCGDDTVAKAPMAPRVVTRSRSDDTAPTAERQPDDAPAHHDVVGDADRARMARAMTLLRQIRQEIERNADYVGERFPEEARRIHYGETEERRIYGEATRSEAEALEEEGIEVVAIPWLPRSDG